MRTRLITGRQLVRIQQHAPNSFVATVDNTRSSEHQSAPSFKWEMSEVAANPLGWLPIMQQWDGRKN